MNFVSKYIKTLSYDDIVQITKDYEQFEKDGFIDDCLLRLTARKIINDNNISGGSIVLWMDKVAFESYRHLAKLHIAGISKR